MVDKLPFLPDEHHYAIAAVATRASQLEHSIEIAIKTALLNSPRTAQHLLKALNTDRIVSLFEAVYADAMPHYETNIGELTEAIQAARAERNEIMHWIWGKSDQPDVAVHAMMRPFRKAEPKTKTAAQVQAVATRLMDCTVGVIWYQDAFLYGLVKSWPDKREQLPLPPSFPSASKPGQKQKLQGPPRQRRRPQA